MTNAGVEIRKEWLEASDSCLEPLTFGELELGQKFIGFPTPGDNHGHGGFRKAAYIFTKTAMRITEAAPGLPFHPDNPHGRAIRKFDGAISEFPDSMFVLLVE